MRVEIFLLPQSVSLGEVSTMTFTAPSEEPFVAIVISGAHTCACFSIINLIWFHYAFNVNRKLGTFRYSSIYQKSTKWPFFHNDLHPRNLIDKNVYLMFVNFDWMMNQQKLIYKGKPHLIWLN